MIRLVTGGRLYSMQPYDWLRLDALGATALYEGEADGADFCALGWATSRGLPVRRFPAEWDAHGKAAGPMRNAAMLEAAREEAQQTGQPLLVAAFPGGSGTADAGHGPSSSCSTGGISSPMPSGSATPRPRCRRQVGPCQRRTGRHIDIFVRLATRAQCMLGPGDEEGQTRGGEATARASRGSC